MDKILIDEKPYKNILVYIISYKTLISAKPFWITFDKIDGFITLRWNYILGVIFSYEI